jgi:hypothetical protein
MTSTKYIGMDVHKESISIQVMNSVGKAVMECVIETKASTILQFLDGLRGDLRVTFEEGTWAAWLYDLLKPHVTEVVVCNPRKAALPKDGSKGDRIDAHNRTYRSEGCHSTSLAILSVRVIEHTSIVRSALWKSSYLPCGLRPEGFWDHHGN